MDEFTLNEIIIRQLSGTATVEDLTILNSWLEEDDGNHKTYDTLYNIQQLSSNQETYFLPDKEKAWGKIMDNITIPKNRNRTLYMFLKYSAAAAVFFMFGLFIDQLWNNQNANEFDQQYSTLIVPFGQKAETILPDGSRVWLNSGTSLKYSKNFNKNNREVILSGEAFFEVEKDKSHKFSVSTGNSIIEVYGTAFDIKNYSTDNQLELSVKEGKVGFLNEGRKVSSLTANEQLVLEKDSKKLQLGKADIDIVTAWKNNELVFNATKVSEVVKYLERWYGVNIRLENYENKDIQYTFRVKTESLLELLKLINIMTPIKYTVNGKEVTIRFIDIEHNKKNNR
jgi:transmembrane sensor